MFLFFYSYFFLYTEQLQFELFIIKGTVKLQVFFAEKDTPSVYEQRDVFLFPKFHL